MTPWFTLGVLIWLATTVNAIPTRPPGVYSQPAYDVYFKPGETVTLPCVAYGYPAPQYLWKRDGKDFNPSGNDYRMVQLANAGTIVINKPEDKDEGFYQCFAKNEYGVSTTINVNLREAKLISFPVSDDETYRPQLGSHLTLNCVPPTSYPSAFVYWVMKDHTGAFDAINYDKRISMDQEHRLRITNIKAEDSQHGKAYVCMAVNYFMRLNSYGNRHFIVPQGSTEEKRPVTYLWATPTDHFGLLGEELRLKCIFSGNPTPNVFWRRNNKNLTDRHETGSFTQELIIENLQFSDAGEYECWGTNSETASQVSRTFAINVESKPYWIKEPQDIETSVGAKATFLCEAGGVPEPRVYWFINGVPLKDSVDPRISSNRFIQHSDNNITLVNLTKGDAMVIQCNATNKHSYIFADVYLNVLMEAPFILRPPEKVKKAAEGMAINLTCRTSGKPDPIITWFKNDYQITGGRYKTLLSGDLNIEKLVLADAGVFRCEAENIKGKQNRTGQLIVRRKTRIESKPMDLEVNAGVDAKFTCSGTTDYEEVGSLTVSWMKDSKLITTNDQRMTQTFQDSSLTISGTISRDSGTYTCIVSNGLDNATASAILTVKDRPDPPSDLQVIKCSESYADIRWTKGSSNNAPIQYFIIQYNTSFDKDQWVYVDYTVGSQTTETIVLSPWAKYTFRVIAKNKIGESEPSFPTTDVCITQPDRPSAHPQNVRSIGDKKGALVIEWTPMSLIQQNGPGFQYILLIQKKGETYVETVTIEDWTRYRHEKDIGSSGAFLPYIVQLKAKNNRGEASDNPIRYTLHSGEDVPQKVVRDFAVDETRLDQNSATFTWTWDVDDMDNTAMRGQFQGFKIQFWRPDQAETTFREVEILTKDMRLVPGINERKKRSLRSYEATIYNLHSYTRYVVQIRVMNTFYAGQVSAEVSIQTLEGVPGPVQSFKAVIKGSNHFYLEWVVPEEVEQGGEIIGYHLGYQTVNGLELGKMQDREPQILERYITKAVLSGLLTKTKYRVHIWAFTKLGRGEDTFLELETTTPGLPDAPIFNIERVGLTFVNITWRQSPEPGARAGTVYYVEYRKLGASDWQQTTEEEVYNWKNVTNLESGTTYEVRVVTTNGINMTASGTQEVTTTGVASAISLVGNIGWFLGMLFAVLVVICIGVLIWFLRRKRKDVPEPTRYKAPQSKQPIHTREPEPGGQHNDYFKDRDRESYDDNMKRNEAAGDWQAPKPALHDYQADSYYRDYYDKDYTDYGDKDDRGYEEYDRNRDRKNYDERDYDRDEHYDDQDPNRKPERDNDDRDYDHNYDRGDRDQKYDNRDYYCHQDRDYHDYDEKQYNQDDRSPGYDKRPPSDAYEDYQREPSKFDSSGSPVQDYQDKPPPPAAGGGGAGMGAMSSFV